MSLENKTKKELIELLEGERKKNSLILTGVKEKDESIEDLRSKIDNIKNTNRVAMASLEENYKQQIKQFEASFNEELEKMRKSANASYHEYKHVSKGLVSSLELVDSIKDTLSVAVEAFKGSFIEGENSDG